MKLLWLLLMTVLLLIQNYGEANEKYSLMTVESLLDMLNRSIIDMSKTKNTSKAETTNQSAKNNDENWSNAWTNIMEHPPATVSVREGDRVELNCTAGGGPPPTILWITKKNIAKQFGELLKDAFGFDKDEDGLARVHSKYVIECATPLDTGLIYCLSISKDQVKVATPTKLIVHSGPEDNNYCADSMVQVKPTVILHTAFRLSDIGQRVSLPCKFIGADNARTTWLHNGQEIQIDKKKYSINQEDSLVINPIDWNDMGEYVCRVTVNNTQAEASMFLYPMAPSGSDQSFIQSNSSTASNEPK